MKKTMSIITVSGKHVEVGENLKTFVETEIQAFMEHSVGDFIDAHVVITKVNGLFGSEIDVHISRGLNIRSHGQDADPYTCVTQAMNLLKQRTHRYRARLRGMERHRKSDKIESMISRYIIAESQEEENVQESPLIIAEMMDSIELMSVGDAVMRLDLTDLPLFVFKNIATNQLNIVYRRIDRNVGWIVPKILS